MVETSPAKIKNTIERFEASVREHAFIGAQHPMDHLSIERAYHHKKAALLALFGIPYTMPTEDDE